MLLKPKAFPKHALKPVPNDRRTDPPRNRKAQATAPERVGKGDHCQRTLTLSIAATLHRPELLGQCQPTRTAELESLCVAGHAESYEARTRETRHAQRPAPGRHGPLRYFREPPTVSAGRLPAGLIGPAPGTNVLPAPVCGGGKRIDHPPLGAGEHMVGLRAAGHEPVEVVEEIAGIDLAVRDAVRGIVRIARTRQVGYAIVAGNKLV